MVLVHLWEKRARYIAGISSMGVPEIAKRTFWPVYKHSLINETGIASHPVTVLISYAWSPPPNSDPGKGRLLAYR